MTKWEYYEESDLQLSSLQLLGAGGWELAAIRSDPYERYGEIVHRHTYVFKRPLPEEA